MPSIESITFRDAERLVERNWQQFQADRANGLVGFGVADRDDAIRFIVKTRDMKSCARLRRKYEGKFVEGLPVYVEVRDRVPLAAAADDGGPVLADRADSRRGLPTLACALWDRPGFIVVGAGVLLTAIWLLVGPLVVASGV